MRRVLVLALAGCGRFGFDAGAGPCPEELVFVPGSTALGTGDFCVMRFEAKARAIDGGVIALTGCDEACAPNSLVTTHLPAAVPEGTPWNQIDAVQARARCQALGPGYDLMANREWMTIARDAERVGANWSGGAPGAGRIVEGTTDGSPAGGVSDPNDPWSDSGNSAADPPGMGWEQRRTLVLGTGEVIWDLPGNMQEWVDWRLGGALDGAPTPCAGAELPAFTCAGIGDDDFNSTTGTLDSFAGIGMILGGDGDATRRGGQQSDLQFRYAGIYALNMNRFVTDVFPGTTFRCVLRL